jgi:hypothetical protein
MRLPLPRPALVAFALLASAAGAAEAALSARGSIAAAPLEQAGLAPALEAAALRDDILLFHIEGPDPAPRVGDYTVAWVGTTNGDVSQQWLVQFRRSAATPREQRWARDRPVKKYLSWGPVIAFRSEVEALEVWIAGPVRMAAATTPAPTLPADADPTPVAPAPTKRLRMLVPADYLRLGLDDALRVDEHLRRRRAALLKDDPAFNLGHLYSREKPIKPESLAAARPVAEKLGFTPEMERAWCGGSVALGAFYDLINEFPELAAIAHVALAQPPLWKLAQLATGTPFTTSLGGESSRAVDPASMGLLPIGSESFDAPFAFQLGAEPLVSGRIVVSHPTPPFDTSAGILALVAVHPQNPARVVQVAMITAARGPGSP